MHKLIFASNNTHKLQEIAEAVGNSFQLISLSDAGIREEVPETGQTLEANALQKARYVQERLGLDCFADDTGLEVHALNNEPGVYSARYAGGQKNADANMDLLLQKLQGVSNRSAQFRTVIALILNKREYLFEGLVKGHIAESKSGNKGFGYDPVFIPAGLTTCFAEMSLEEKNRISHRALAVKKLVGFLQKQA